MRVRRVWQWMLGGALTLGLASCTPDEKKETVTGPPDPVPGIGYPGLSARANGMAEFDGSLVAVGSFRTAGDSAVRNVASWNGTSWSSLDMGLFGVGNPALTERANAARVWNDALYVGGLFRYAGADSLDVQSIASWDGTSWSDVALGVTGVVEGMSEYNGNLIVYGEFEGAGIASARNVAQYDGTEWSVFGTGTLNGVNGPVYSATVWGDKLIVGGAFTSTGAGRVVFNVAMWDPTVPAWLPMGRGFAGDVLAVTTYQDQVYAAGLFSEAEGRWTTQPAAEAPGAVSHISMGVDGADGAQLVYYDETNADLVHAIQDGDDWLTSTIDSGGDVGQYADFVLTESGEGHVAYYDATSGDLKYATRPLEEWLIETVAGDTANVGVECSIGLNRQNRPVIAFMDVTANTLKLAFQIPSLTEPGTYDWQFRSALMDPTGVPIDPVGYWTDLAVDSRDRVHVILASMDGQDLSYALYDPNLPDGSRWSYAQDIGGTRCERPAIVLDRNDVVHVAYYDPTASGTTGRQRAQYITRSAAGVWASPLPVSTRGNTGAYPSIAVANDGTLFISHQRARLAEIGPGATVAFRRPGEQIWLNEIVSAGSGVGAWSSLAVFNGKPRVAFFDANTGEVEVSTQRNRYGVRRVARWNDTASEWEPVGDGLDWWARTFMEVGGDLLLGGAFETAGSVATQHLARWNGTAWTAMGRQFGGMDTNTHVWSLGTYQGHVVAAGRFTSVGGLESNYIVQLGL